MRFKVEYEYNEGKQGYIYVDAEEFVSKCAERPYASVRNVLDCIVQDYLDKNNLGAVDHKTSHIVLDYLGGFDVQEDE